MVHNLGHCFTNHKIEWNKIRSKCLKMHNFQSYLKKISQRDARSEKQRSFRVPEINSVLCFTFERNVTKFFT